MKGTYLITCDSWFTAPDGKQYKAVWGNVEIMDDTVLGVKTNCNATNWYAKIGTEENHIIIAGCQIHYSVKCSKPITGRVDEYVTDASVGLREFTRPSQIYIFE